MSVAIKTLAYAKTAHLCSADCFRLLIDCFCNSRDWNQSIPRGLETLRLPGLSVGGEGSAPGPVGV